MITTVSCGLLLQLTRQLVNLSTRQLQIMITTFNCGLSLQLTRQLVNLSTRQLVNYPYKGKSLENKKKEHSFEYSFCDSDRIQTCNLLIRSQVLYSVELRNHYYGRNR